MLAKLHMSLNLTYLSLIFLFVDFFRFVKLCSYMHCYRISMNKSLVYFSLHFTVLCMATAANKDMHRPILIKDFNNGEQKLFYDCFMALKFMQTPDLPICLNSLL